MALQITTKEREFSYKGELFVDPDPMMTPSQVAKFYSARFPELVNTSINGPELIEGKARYTFSNSVGTKG